jgi:hypothetical protein
MLLKLATASLKTSLTPLLKFFVAPIAAEVIRAARRAS